LVTVQGYALVEYVIAMLAPQVSGIVINANRNRSRYERYGYPVVADVLPDYPGPLAGIMTGLRHARHDDVVVPCDAPSLPDPVERPYQALVREQADAVPCMTASGCTRSRPVTDDLTRRWNGIWIRQAQGGRLMREQRPHRGFFRQSARLPHPEHRGRSEGSEPCPRG
jgi:hypothetical protein